MPSVREIAVVLPDDRRVDSYVTSVAFSPDGKLVAFGERYDRVDIYDIGNGKLVHPLAGQFAYAPVTFSSAGRLLAFVGRDHETVTLWNLDAGREVSSLRSPHPAHHFRSVESIVFSPDGKFVVTAGMQARLRDVLAGPRGEADLWRVDTGEKVAEVVAHDGPIYGTAFSPDGKVLALVSGTRLRQYGVGDGKLRLVAVPSGKVLAKVEAHGDWATAVAFSPDGQTVATGSGDRTVKLWDAHTAKEKMTLRGHTAVVQAVAFTPDGKWLATAGENVRLWDPSTGKEFVGIFPKTAAQILTFAPDGKTVVTGNAGPGIGLFHFTAPSH